MILRELLAKIPAQLWGPSRAPSNAPIHDYRQVMAPRGKITHTWMTAQGWGSETPLLGETVTVG